MPARTLNDFFAGFFYGRIRVDLEVNVIITLQKGQEKVKEIKVKGEWEKEMSTQWEARRAVSMLNRTDFMGKNLLVREAIVRRGFRGR